jgi:hypothetical protein
LYGLFSGELLFDISGETRWALMISSITSISEFLGGYFAADSFNLDSGESLLLGINTGIGSFWGGMTAYLLGGIPEDEVAARLFWGESFLGSLGGFGLGLLMLNAENYTEGDSTILFQFVLEGALAGYTLSSFFSHQSKDLDFSTRITSGMLLGGSLGGMVLGHFLLSDLDFATFDSGMISLGTMGGGLLGFGIGYLIEANNEIPDSRVLSTSAFLGSSAGLALTFWLFQDNALLAKDDNGLRISIHPESLLLFRPRGNSQLKLPLFKVTYNF